MAPRQMEGIGREAICSTMKWLLVEGDSSDSGVIVARLVGQGDRLLQGFRFRGQFGVLRFEGRESLANSAFSREFSASRASTFFASSCVALTLSIAMAS